MPDDTKKTILYCSDSSADERILRAVRRSILVADLPIVSVTQHPLDFGRNVCVGDIGRSLRSYATQLMVGLSMIQTGVVYIAEQDILYHPSHFALLPENPRMGYFDANAVFGVVSEDCYYPWVKTSQFGMRALGMSLGHADWFLEHCSRLAIRIWNGWKYQITPWDCTACISAEGPSVLLRHGNNQTAWAQSGTPQHHLEPWGKLSEALANG